MMPATRNLLRTTCLALAFLIAHSTQAAQRPPNIVLIVSDDQGYRDLGCAGSPEILTPNLDRLAREGTRLTSFYVTWPACTPSRGSLLTGRYPQRNGIYDMIRNEAPDYGLKYRPEDYAVTFERIGGMDTREVLIPRVLAASGYRSAIFGKWDLGIHKRYLPLSRGFDEFYGFVNTGIDYYTHERYGVPSMYRDNHPTEADKGTYCTDLFRREGVRFVNESEERPFFLYLPFNAPHNSSALDPTIRSSIQAPEKYQAMYPEPAEPQYITKPYRYQEEARIPSQEVRRRNYMAAVTCMDAAIGEIMSLLDSKGLTDNTLVIFFSDNGGSGGADNTPLRGSKGKVFEGGIRVPCIVRWPGHVPAGKVSDAFLTTLELMPTFCAASGARPPEGVILDGFDMLPVLRGEMESPRKEMFWQRRGDKAARVGSIKWVESRAGSGLFDLSKDIGEKNDLSKKRPELLAEVKARFAAWTAAMEAAEPRGPFRDF